MTLTKAITSERGAVFVETAIVLPLYFIMLGICVDMPRLLAFRQHLMGASRMAAELDARGVTRGPGGGAVDWSEKDAKEALHGWFLGRMCDDPESISVKTSTQRPAVSGKIRELGNRFNNLLGGMGEKVSGFLTLGEKSAFFDDVFEEDKLFGAKVTAKVNVILPPAFYKSIMNMDLDKDGQLKLSAPYTCYMPNCNSDQKNTSKNPIADMVDWIRGFMDKCKWVLGGSSPLEDLL